MTASSPKRRATYADVRNAPEHQVAELIDGDLHLHPRPAGPHANAASVLGMDLGSAFHRGRGGPGGWWILDEPELHFGEDVLVPDLAGWRRERLPAIDNVSYFELAPDWVCEVLSPKTQRVDRVLKLPRYAAAGVAHAWLVDPQAQVLEIYRLEGGRWVLLATHGGAERGIRAEPFQAIELDLTALWVEAAAK